MERRVKTLIKAFRLALIDTTHGSNTQSSKFRFFFFVPYQILKGGKAFINHVGMTTLFLGSFVSVDIYLYDCSSRSISQMI